MPPTCSRTARLLMLILSAHVASAAEAVVPEPISGFELYTDASLTTPGLEGSYVDQSLASISDQDDWRSTQAISGTRVDRVEFDESGDWGSRSSVGVTGGSSDADWDQFSVQWDGYLSVTKSGVRMATISDDGSRMWIDLNHDGVFSTTAPELLDNNWGGNQAATRGQSSPQLAVGLYRIRIQYYEESSGAAMSLVNSIPTVRFAYVIPSNRVAQPNAIENLEGHVMPMLHRWYCDQMDRNGAGRMAPNFERHVDGRFRAHLVPVAEPDDELRASLYGATLGAIANAGVQFRDGEVWMLIPETHRLHSDGTIDGASSVGTTWGDSTDSPGATMTESVFMALMNRNGILDDRRYDGLTIPSIGPFPLVQDVSFAPWGGPTISSNVSNIMGALGHELTHGFGIAHDGRNEMGVGDVGHGNMMGIGFAHFRGAIHPERYPNEHMRLSWADAQTLALSDYFRSCDPDSEILDPRMLTADDQPSVEVLTAGPLNPVGGEIRIDVQASDPDGLAIARLDWNGGYVDDLMLSGTSASFELQTTYFEKSEPNSFTVYVYDVKGNRAGKTTSIVPGSNPDGSQGPRANLIAVPAQANPDEKVTLHALPGTSDDETPNEDLEFEWILEEGASPVSTGNVGSITTSYSSPGVQLARVRVTDGRGHVSTSSPVAIRVAHACSDGLDNDGMSGTDFDSGVSILGSTAADPDGSDPECSSGDTSREAPEPGVATGVLTGTLSTLGAAARRRRLQSTESRSFARG